MLFLLASVLCSLYLIWKLWFKTAYLEPPLLSGWLPIIGHGYKIMGNEEKMLKSINKIGEECTEKGGIVTIYLGWRKLYCVTDPDDSLTISNTCLEKPFFYNFMKPLVGNGLLTADVPTWKRNRKLLNPAFNQQVLDGFIEIFNSQAEKIMDRFVKEIGKPFDHEKILRVNNLETICCTSLGVYRNDPEYSDIFTTQYLPYLSDAILAINKRVQKFWLYSDFIYNMTQEKKQMDEALKHITTLSKSIIQKKKAEMRNLKKNVSDIENKPVSGNFKPFIDLILSLANETNCFTEEQIKAETESVIVGGHETSATMLTFTLAVLGSHPEVQEKAYQEVCNVLGNLDKRIDKEDLNKLVYIEAILKEMLRLYEVVPVLPRYSENDVKLKKYTLKAKSDCIILLQGIHRHNMWGTSPDEFRPERWMDKKTLPDPKYFGAFGLGRRSCIGKTYAMMSMKVILANTVKKFQIASDVSKMVTKMQVLLRPQSGHYIILTPRNI